MQRTLIGLADLGAVRVHGPDTLRFLQGQLSNDMQGLSAQRSLLAGYHNPQGRTIALLRLIQLEPDNVLAIVPRDLETTVVSRLSRFILRAKVRITAESDNWLVSGLIVEGALPPDDALPAELNEQRLLEGHAIVQVGQSVQRWLRVSPVGHPARMLALLPGADDRRARGEESGAVGAPAEDPVPGDPEVWRGLEVGAGQPQVYAATSEQFVAQMLNLDVIGAISFEKGCYTGQEVIARSHYRGRMKRRLQRFQSREPCELAPGDSGQLADGRSFKVVIAAKLPSGRCDFLAVAPLAGGERQSQEPGEQQVLLADPVPLPYSLPQ